MKTPSFLIQSRSRLTIYSFLILVAIATVFWQLRSAQFLLWDDDILVSNNPFYSEPNAPSLLFFWRHPYLNLYMPVTYTVWGLVAQLTRTIGPGGENVLDATVYHSISLVLHGANALLVFGLLRTFLRAPLIATRHTDSDTDRHAGRDDLIKDSAAVAGTLLFALHPLQVETVAWISELKGLLAAFFSLAALLMFCHFLTAAKSQGGAPLARKWWIGAVCCFAGALLSKPSVVGVPFIAFMLAYLLWGYTVAAAWRTLWPWFVMSLVMALAMTRIQVAGPALQGVHYFWRPVIASDAWSFYLSKFFIPTDLTINYGRTPQWLMQQPWAKAMLIVPLFVGGMVWLARKQKAVLLIVGWITIVLLPNLGFVPFLFQSYSTVADRYFYIAMVAPSLGLTLSLNAVYDKWPFRASVTAWILCALALGGLGLLARRQSGIWHDNTSLYTYALTVNPNDWGTLSNLGNIYYDNKNYSDAIRLYERAIAVKPRAVAAYLGMANANRVLRRPEEAMRYYRLALQLKPDFSKARMGLATLLDEQGDDDGALKEFETFFKYSPKDATALVYAGQIHVQQGDFLAGEQKALEALRVDDQYAAAHILLGVVYVQRKDKRNAVKEYGRALELDPTSATARVYIAQILVEGGLREQAMNIVKEGLALTPGDSELLKELSRLKSLR